MEIKAIAADIHRNAVLHGWWPEDEERSVPEIICLIHSELSEGLEAYRKDIPEGAKGRPSEELADATIRILDMTEGLGIDLEAAILKKHEYNKTRSHRHGGKRC